MSRSVGQKPMQTKEDVVQRVEIATSQTENKKRSIKHCLVPNSTIATCFLTVSITKIKESSQRFLFDYDK